MNVEFKESFFRYIFPATLFWGILMLQNFHLIHWIKHNISLGLFFLLFTGLIISSLGVLIVFILSHVKGNEWLTKIGEYRNWKNLEGDDKKVRKEKVDRRWSLFIANLNSAIAILLAIIFGDFNYHECILLSSIFMFIVFVVLAIDSFNRSKYFNEELKENK